VQALVGRRTWHGTSPWCPPADRLPRPPSEAVPASWVPRPARRTLRKPFAPAAAGGPAAACHPATRADVTSAPPVMASAARARAQEHGQRDGVRPGERRRPPAPPARGALRAQDGGGSPTPARLPWGMGDVPPRCRRPGHVTRPALGRPGWWRHACLAERLPALAGTPCLGETSSQVWEGLIA